MSNNSLSMDELDDILARVHEELEGGAIADRIKEIADEHPQARADILAFAAEWFASDGSDLDDDVLSVDRTISEHTVVLERFWDLHRPAAADPFEVLDGDALKSVADRCHIDMVVLRQLVSGLIDEATIPGKLIALLASATNTTMAAVLSHLSSPQMMPSTDFYAPDGRRSGPRRSFAEAVRASDMSDDDKQFWLAHLAV